MNNIELLLSIYGAIISFITIFLTYRQYIIQKEERRDKEIQDFKEIYEALDKKITKIILKGTEKSPDEIFGDYSDVLSSIWATKPQELRERVVQTLKKAYEISEEKFSQEDPLFKTRELIFLRDSFAEELRKLLKIEEYEKRGKNLFLDIWALFKNILKYVFWNK